MSTFTTSPLSALLSTTPLDPTTQKHIRRVYTTLSLSLLTATLAALLDLSTSLPLGHIATLCTLPSLLYFNFSQRYSRSRTLSFYVFAACSGMSCGPLLAVAGDLDPSIPVLALAGCTLVFAGLSLSALFAKRRAYLALGGVLWIAVWGMLLLGVVNLFTPRLIGFGVMLYGGLLMLCAFVLYDTQVIVEKVSAGDTDYVGHAMTLLIDFVGMFKRLLIIMIRNQERRRREDRKRDQC